MARGKLESNPWGRIGDPIADSMLARRVGSESASPAAKSSNGAAKKNQRDTGVAGMKYRLDHATQQTET
jgi:hypothetical protein